jgi:hypothetical protein
MLAHVFIRIVASGIFCFAAAALLAAAEVYKIAGADCEYVASIGFLAALVAFILIAVAAVAIIIVSRPPLSLLEQSDQEPLPLRELDVVR